MIATNGDAGAIRIIFIRMHFTDNHGVADFFSFMPWNVLKVNENEGVSATDKGWCGRINWGGRNRLGEIGSAYAWA